MSPCLPSAGSRGTGSWSTSVIRPLLKRERYRGVIAWGEFEKTYSLGTKVRVRRAADDADRVRVEVPELRIVDDDLWFAVQARFTRREGGNKQRGRLPRHLLSGIGRCAQCGGPIIVSNGRHGKESIHVYPCGYHRQRGPEVCTNTLRRPLMKVNEQVIAWIQACAHAGAGLPRRCRSPRSAPSGDRGGEKQIRAAASSGRRSKEMHAGEIDRLVGALAVTDDKPDAIVNGIAERQARLRDFDAKISAAKAAPQVVEDTLALGGSSDASLDAIRRFHETVKAHPDQARDVVAALFDKIVFTPVSTPAGPRYELEGVAEIGRLLTLDSGAKQAIPRGSRSAVDGVFGVQR